MARNTQTFFLILLMIFATTTANEVISSNVTCNCLSMQSLLTLVQHQVTTMEQQAAMIQATRTQLTSLQTSSFQQSLTIQDLKAKMTDVNKNVNKQLDGFKAQLEAKAKMGKVAFTAHMSATSVNVGANGPFIFDVVITNIGESYNSHSGIFVAPYNGVYVFSFIMINDGNAPTIHAQIEKNGVVLGVGTSDGLGEYNKWDDGSVLVTTHLEKGNHVYVTRRDGGTKVYGNVYTNFSGFLLSADP